MTWPNVWPNVPMFGPKPRTNKNLLSVHPIVPMLHFPSKPMHLSLLHWFLCFTYLIEYKFFMNHKKYWIEITNYTSILFIKVFWFFSNEMWILWSFSFATFTNFLILGRFSCSIFYYFEKWDHFPFGTIFLLGAFSWPSSKYSFFKSPSRKYSIKGICQNQNLCSWQRSAFNAVNNCTPSLYDWLQKIIYIFWIMYPTA